MNKMLVAFALAVAMALPIGGVNATGIQNAMFPPKYCNIGGDPVNIHRKRTADEEFRFLARDVTVTMGTGSGKDVRCVLKKGEQITVSKTGRSLPWVVACGNPLREHLSGEALLSVPEQARSASLPPRGLIILGIYESTEFARAKASQGSVITDSAGKPVTDSRNVPVKGAAAH